MLSSGILSVIFPPAGELVASKAPITEEERLVLMKLLPEVWNDLTPAARKIIKSQGVAYVDEEGDLVTSIVGGKDCVFTCYGEDGMCMCAIEKAYREGRVSFYKPLSCHLYPIRVTRYPAFTAVNYHRWKICKAAEVLGRKEGVKVYRFLREPLIRSFGEEWYDELDRTAQAYLQQKESGEI